MKQLLTVLAVSLFALTANAQKLFSIMVNTNGVIVQPTNFWTANQIESHATNIVWPVAGTNVVAVTNGNTVTINSVGGSGSTSTNGLATTNFVAAAVAGLAPTNNPTFSGPITVSGNGTNGSFAFYDSTGTNALFGHNGSYYYGLALGLTGITAAAISSGTLPLERLSNINSNNFDAPTRAMLGGGGGSGSISNTGSYMWTGSNTLSTATISNLYVPGSFNLLGNLTASSISASNITGIGITNVDGLEAALAAIIVPTNTPTSGQVPVATSAGTAAYKDVSETLTGARGTNLTIINTASSHYLTNDANGFAIDSIPVSSRQLNVGGVIGVGSLYQSGTATSQLSRTRVMGNASYTSGNVLFWITPPAGNTVPAFQVDQTNGTSALTIQSTNGAATFGTAPAAPGWITLTNLPPTAAPTAGASFMWNSNGVHTYIILSGYNSTVWSATNTLY